jgi:predicted nuclease of predicted toxin-antitoxin system
MKLILDEGMPLRAAAMLRQAQVDAWHVLEVGMQGASDQAILDRARLDGAMIATLDADFHQILAITGADRPSVIRVRIECLQAQQLAELLLNLLQRIGEDLSTGVAVSIDRKQIRLRRLPLHVP